MAPRLKRLLRGESGRKSGGSHVMVELRSVWKSICLAGKMQAERTEISALSGGVPTEAPTFQLANGPGRLAYLT
jgi:hypothetical protein